MLLLVPALPPRLGGWLILPLVALSVSHGALPANLVLNLARLPARAPAGVSALHS